MLSLTVAVEPQQIVNSNPPAECTFSLSSQINPWQPYPSDGLAVGYSGVVPLWDGIVCWHSRYALIKLSSAHFVIKSDMKLKFSPAIKLCWWFGSGVLRSGSLWDGIVC